jgi:ATP-binding cassette subfamily F protein 3
MHSRPVTALSGGERRRLALALLVASGANFLVLDEPTNHLDVESREALEAALEAFAGTILLVSHDRALLDAVPDRTVLLRDRSLRSYPGGWADLQDALAAPTPAPPARPEPKPSKPQRPRVANAKRPPSELELLEQRIAETEAQVEKLEHELALDWTNTDALAGHRAARDELQSLLERWEVLFGEVESR